jgi:hypothetical protein
MRMLAFVAVMQCAAPFGVPIARDIGTATLNFETI